MHKAPEDYEGQGALMKKKSPFFFLMPFFCFSSVFCSTAMLIDVDFDDSMQTYAYPKKKEGTVSSMVFQFFKTQYEKNRFEKIEVQSDYKIPKLFHYIWLGKKLPDQYRPLLQTWLDTHPDWIFLIWVDNLKNYDLGTPLENADFSFIQDVLDDENSRGGVFVVDVKNIDFKTRTFFDESKNYGERSDILRWELLHQFGGVYIDVDCECFKPFDVLNRMYDFYTGIQPLDTSTVQLGSGLVGAAPGHPILKECVEKVSGNKNLPIVIRTGPILFTRAFIHKFFEKDLINVALPASYFYPCSYEQAGLPEMQWRCDESFAVHHWAGSWLKEEGWDRS